MIPSGAQQNVSPVTSNNLPILTNSNTTEVPIKTLNNNSKNTYKKNNNANHYRGNKKYKQQYINDLKPDNDDDIQLALEMSRVEYEEKSKMNENKSITTTTTTAAATTTDNKQHQSKKKNQIDVTHLINFGGTQKDRNNNNNSNNNSNNHRRNNYHNNNYSNNNGGNYNNRNNNNNNYKRKEHDKKGKKNSSIIKEVSFLQAKYSFYINPYGSYTNSLSNPDTLVSWNKIEQAIYVLNQPNEFQCPICFDPPFAPKITKCGHIGCWGCLLRNLAHTDKCPLCLKPITKDELKSIKIIQTKKFEESDEIKLNLVKYIGNSTVPYLSTQEIPEKISFPDEKDPNSLFSRFSIINSIESILEKEQGEINTAIEIATSEHESQTLKFLTMASQEIEDRRIAFQKLIESRIPQDNFIITSIPKNKQMKFDSFQYSNNLEIRMALEEFYDSHYVGTPDSSFSDDGDAFDSYSNLTASTTTTTTTTPKEPNPILLPPSSHNKNNNNNNNLKYSSYEYENQPYQGSFYIYQSSDSQDIYIHPLCMKILSKEYMDNSDKQLPSEINAKILEVETLEVTKLLRHKYKCLSVIPLTTPITFIEIDMSSLVSKATLDQFSSELSQRRDQRGKKKHQEQRKQRNKEKERFIDIKRSIELREINEKEKQVKQEQERIRLEQELKEKKEEDELRQQKIIQQANSKNHHQTQPKFSSVLDAIVQHKNIESTIEFPSLK